MQILLKCLIVDDDDITRELMASYVDRHHNLALADTCADGIEAINVLRSQSIDVIFLDIEMPEMSGIELIQSLKSRPQIVLATSKEEYAIKAFQEGVTDYLVKPVSYARFVKSVERVMELAPNAVKDATQDYVFIKSNGRLIKLNLKSVKWIEAQSDYMLIYTDRGKHLIHSTMKKLITKLPAKDFARVHRSYIVRIDKIEDIDDATIVIDKKVIPIGASHREKLLSRLHTL